MILPDLFFIKTSNLNHLMVSNSHDIAIQWGISTPWQDQPLQTPAGLGSAGAESWSSQVVRSNEGGVPDSQTYDYNNIYIYYDIFIYVY